MYTKDVLMISILILEDNITLAERLRGILLQWEFVAGVQMTATAAQANMALETQTWDVFLCDLGLPDGDGEQCICTYNKKSPDGSCIVISSKSDDASILSAIRAGAVGYIFKDDHSIQIVDAVKLALNGQSPISPSIAFTVISILAQTKSMPDTAEAPSGSTSLLTEREIQVLSAISKGLTYVETAVVLEISKNTVPVHIRNIYRKLQANNRSEAVYEAQSMGIKL